MLFRSSGTPSFNLKKLFEKTAEQRDPEYVQLQLPVANRPRTGLNLESHERFTASSVTVSESKKKTLFGFHGGQAAVEGDMCMSILKLKNSEVKWKFVKPSEGCSTSLGKIRKSPN